MPERFEGGEPPQEYKMQRESTEFSEQQKIVITEFKEALKKYQQAKETLENYEVRFTPDKGFEVVSFSDWIEEDRKNGIQKEEERIKNEMPNFALKIEPHGSGSGDLELSISKDGGKTFVHYASGEKANFLGYLKKLNKQTLDEHFEEQKKIDDKTAFNYRYDYKKK